MTAGYVQFGNAWGNYVRCNPDALQYRLVLIERSDTAGAEMKRFPKKTEPFEALVTVFANSVAGIIYEVGRWQAMQGRQYTLYLPQGYIPNVVLGDVSKVGPITTMQQASNNYTQRQRIRLQCVQLSEDEA